MARSEARIFTNIWNDEEFLALTPLAQRTYLFLLSQADLNYLGVLALRESRWARKANRLDAAAVRESLDELAKAAYVVVDDDTEELLIRTFIRGDRVYTQPNLLRSAHSALALVESQAIRASLRRELARLLDAEMTKNSRDEIVAMLAELDGGPRKGSSKGSPKPGLGESGEGGEGGESSHSDATSAESAEAETVVGYIAEVDELDGETAGQDGWSKGTEKGSSKGSPKDNANPLGERGVVTAVSNGSPNPLPLDPFPAAADAAAPRARPTIEDRIVIKATGASPEEAAAVVAAVIRQRKPDTPIGFLHNMAKDGDLVNVLTEHRKQAARKNIAAWLEAARKGEDCKHYNPGGALIRPDTNEPLCPQCRSDSRRAKELTEPCQEPKPRRAGRATATPRPTARTSTNPPADARSAPANASANANPPPPRRRPKPSSPPAAAASPPPPQEQPTPAAGEPVIVHVRQTHGDPTAAEYIGPHPTRTNIIEIIYQQSRTAAWIDRARILPDNWPTPTTSEPPPYPPELEAHHAVWISTHRRGIEAHRPIDESTACNRSMRTGHQLQASQARTKHDATWCPRCWPTPKETAA